jgi:hypothetical protein
VVGSGLCSGIIHVNQVVVYMENFEKIGSPEEERLDAIGKIDIIVKEAFDQTYQAMIGNDKVKSSGFKPTKEQFMEYCAFLKKGLEYALSKYGPEAIPENMSFYTGEIVTGDFKDADFIGYFPDEDRLGISFLHAAGQCARYGQPNVRFIDSHLPCDCGVMGEDYTVLQSIEESYHSYQIKRLGFKPENTARNINHPMEKEIIEVFKRAIDDLGIRLHRLK